MFVCENVTMEKIYTYLLSFVLSDLIGGNFSFELFELFCNFHCFYIEHVIKYNNIKYY